MDTGHDVMTRPMITADCSASMEVKRINLALQGGGAHGAFAWGVLDRILEEKRIEIEGISATSAGAMNATVMTYGYLEGGRNGAKQALAGFWRRIAHAAQLSPVQATWWDRMMGNKTLDNSPAFVWLDFVSRVLSPYQLNPMNWNPLREVLGQSVDFERMRGRKLPIKLFLSATNVKTGKVKVFSGDEISADAVLASGCLPFLFQSIEIDDQHYWDGGYMGNPAIFPLIYGCESRDVVIVHINPIERDEVPTSASEIMNRINEISFNSSLMREMRAIGFVSSLIDSGKVEGGLKRMLIHAISAEPVMREFSVMSKLHADWDFLLELKETGHDYADKWIAANFDALGRDSTIDIAATYL